MTTAIELRGGAAAVVLIGPRADGGAYARAGRAARRAIRGAGIGDFALRGGRPVLGARSKQSRDEQEEDGEGRRAEEGRPSTRRPLVTRHGSAP